MGEIPANVPFKVIFDGEDVAFWNIPLNKDYWVIEKDKPIPNSFFDLQHDINLLMEENKKLKKENKELKNIIKCLENGSCRSIDSFLDDYCSDKLLKEYDLID